MAAVLDRTPVPVLIAVTVAIIAGALALLGVVGSGALPDRNGPPVETVAFERTEFEPGTVVLNVRNIGPDPVTVAQITVNDAFVNFDGADGPIGVKEAGEYRLDFPWIEGQPYRIGLLTSTGVVINHELPAAVETPATDAGLFGLMALLGAYVGIVPVILGMLFLPVLRRARANVVRWLLAFTVGLLGFLAIDALIEAIGIGGLPGAFSGVELVFLGAAAAFLLLFGIDRYIATRGEAKARTGSAALSPLRLALMVAIGIGLHNLGEGLAIGSAYSIGELALGASLVIGFAIHNTTEGLAIVAPLGRDGVDGRRAPLLRLLGLGVIAGAPAIVGALIGVTVGMNEIAALLLGVGIGAIVQVVVQIAPALRDAAGRAVDLTTATGMVAGAVVMYLTGLLVVA